MRPQLVPQGALGLGGHSGGHNLGQGAPPPPGQGLFLLGGVLLPAAVADFPSSPRVVRQGEKLPHEKGQEVPPTDPRSPERPRRKGPDAQDRRVH